MLILLLLISSVSSQSYTTCSRTVFGNRNQYHNTSQEALDYATSRVCTYALIIDEVTYRVKVLWKDIYYRNCTFWEILLGDFLPGNSHFINLKLVFVILSDDRTKLVEVISLFKLTQRHNLWYKPKLVNIGVYDVRGYTPGVLI